MNTQIEKSSHQEFLHWYEPIHEQFVRYCRSQAFGILETEDIVQEAVLATLGAFSRIREKEKLLSFMIGVVNNLVKNKRRRAKLNGEWDEKVLDKLESELQDPEVALDIHYLLKALQQLPEKQREAIILFEISGFSIREISEIQESSEPATKTRLHRGRQYLKELLVEEGGKLPLSKRLAIYASILM